MPGSGSVGQSQAMRSSLPVPVCGSAAARSWLACNGRSWSGANRCASAA